MSAKYNSLEELRQKKQLLKKEVDDLQDLLTFENTKESLSAITHGFTDKFLEEVPTGDGDTTVSIKTNEIVKEISNSVKETVFSKNAFAGIANSDATVNVIENTLKIGAVTFIGNFARKSLQDTSWKKKLIGLALIYIAPIALRFIREKLEEYQKAQTTSSFEQLI